jgi:flagellar motor component MotA
MYSLIGLIVVGVAVFGGFAMTGGRLHVLVQPNELVLIAGACPARSSSSAVGNVRGQLVSVVEGVRRSRTPTRGEYL